MHEANWLNCDSKQLKSAIALINKHGRVRGERGLPKLLPGLNFIAGLNGETSQTYDINIKLLNELKDEGHMIRRVNIRQVEGEGFQEIDDSDFKAFKTTVRDEFDGPLLEKCSHRHNTQRRLVGSTRRKNSPAKASRAEARSSDVHGKAGITFGRQIGAYPILVGMNYLAHLRPTATSWLQVTVLAQSPE